MKKFYSIDSLVESKKGCELLDSLYDDEIEVVKALLDLNYGSYDSDKKSHFRTIDDLENAIDDKDKVTYYMDYDSYHDFCDELLEFPKWHDILERYFDYDSYHNDCDYDVSEAYNGILISNW